MSNRRRYKGDEELRLRMLEVTEDPTFGDRAPRKKRTVIPLGMEDAGESSGADRREKNKLH